jgi:hypothetical protein
VQGITEAFQQTAKRAGINIEIIPGDGKQTLTKYRARQHDMYIGQWGADYWDPHTNADTFARNPDNSDDAKSKPLAWRNAWDIPELTKQADAAVLERDPRQAQGHVREDAGRIPQDQPVCDAVPADRGGSLPQQRRGLEDRPTSDSTYMFKVRSKPSAVSLNTGTTFGSRGGFFIPLPPRHRPRFAFAIVLTYLGLLAVTFFIGRVMPIDPVLAVVGDHAPEHVCRVREEMGLNKPLYSSSGIYVQQGAEGDFGTSVLTSNPVLQDIARAFPATFELATLGILIGAGFGVPLGVWAAVRRGGAGRPAGACDGADRLFGADLLAGSDGAGAVLRQARLGGRSRAHRRDV